MKIVAALGRRWYYAVGAFLIACGIGLSVFVTWKAAVGQRQYRNVPRTFEDFARRHVARYNARVESGLRMTVEDFEKSRKQTAALLFADWLYDTNAGHARDNARDLAGLAVGDALAGLREDLGAVQTRSSLWEGATRVTTRHELDALDPDIAHVVFEDTLAGTGGVLRRRVEVNLRLERCPDAAPGNEGVKKFLNCMSYGYRVAEYSIKEDGPEGAGN
ncbi:MAG: hypothetical protein ACJ74Q_15320 [Pyrinomonadaceae bacterium]